LKKVLLGLIFVASSLIAGEDYFVVTESQHQTVYKFNVKNNDYVMIKKSPTRCGSMTLLDHRNKYIKGVADSLSTINEKLQGGNYKLQVIAENGDCNINIIY